MRSIAIVPGVEAALEKALNLNRPREAGSPPPRFRGLTLSEAMDILNNPDRNSERPRATAAIYLASEPDYPGDIEYGTIK